MFSDWVIKVYRKCSIDCIKPPSINSANSLSDDEKTCATNCIRLHEKGYKLYGSVQDQLFIKYMESTGVDPDQLYATMNDMSKETYLEKSKVANASGSSMRETSQNYMGAGQSVSESYYNKRSK